MKSITLILLLLLSTTTWIHGEEEKCNTGIFPPDTPTAGPITIGSKKEELQPPAPKTACHYDNFIRLFGMILCNYDGCCEHCLKIQFTHKSALTGSCLSVSEMRYIPELVRMLEKSKRIEEEFDMFLKDNELV